MVASTETTCTLKIKVNSPVFVYNDSHFLNYYTYRFLRIRYTSTPTATVAMARRTARITDAPSPVSPSD